MRRWSWNPLRWLKYGLLRALKVDRLEALRLSQVFLDPLNLSPPWVKIPGSNPLVGSREGSSSGGESLIEFVSRHDIAESGLWYTTVDQVKHLVCRAGDYTPVCRALLPETGEEVECVVYKYRDSRGSEGLKYLVASPDTEHGDHIYLDRVKEDEGPEAYQKLLASMSAFVRVDPRQLAQERLGGDLRFDEHGNPVGGVMDAKALPGGAEEGDDPIPWVDDREAMPSVLSPAQQYQSLTEELIGFVADREEGTEPGPSEQQIIARRNEVWQQLTEEERIVSRRWEDERLGTPITASQEE